MSPVLAAPLVDGAALLQVLWTAALGALVVGGCFSGGVALTASGSAARRVAGGVLFAVCLAAVVAGVYVVLTQKG